jgi:hypothetical protein
MPSTEVASVAPKARAYSGRPFRASATAGIAVATAMDSKASREISATAPTQAARRPGAKSLSVDSMGMGMVVGSARFMSVVQARPASRA